MAIGITNAKVLSFSIKIFLTAGSNSQAIEAVVPATTAERASANTSLHICSFT